MIGAVSVSVCAWLPAARADHYVNTAHLNTAYANDHYINDHYINDHYINNAFINGGMLDGGPVGGMTKSGTPIEYVGLYRSELTGWTWRNTQGTQSWTYRSGAWFVGAHVNGSFLNPTTGDRVVVDLRIDSFERAPAPDDDVTVYAISAHLQTLDPTTNMLVWGWHPVCGYDEQGAPAKAIPLQGNWNLETGSYFGGAKISASADTVTFACLGGALGKCAAAYYPNTLGYKPWVSRWMIVWNDATSTYEWTYDDQEDIHQACTRMIRDDFCGDGTSYTVTGMPIDVYDWLGYHMPEYAEPWLFEATWLPDGARWVDCERVVPFHDTCPYYRDVWGFWGDKQHLTTRGCSYPTEDPALTYGEMIGDRSLDPWSSLFETTPPPSM